MTQTPNGPAGQSGQGENVPPPLDYQMQSKMSGMAITSMVLGILSIPLGCVLLGIPIGIVGLVLGIIGLIKINKEPQRFGGKGMAITGIVTSIIGIVAVGPALLIAILLPSLGRAREIANRTTCAVNLKGIVQSLQVYGADNSDSFPIVPFAPYGPSNAGTASVILGTKSEDAIGSLYTRSSSQKGSPLANVWILVLRGDIAPKSLLCKSDEWAKTPASLTSAAAEYYVNIQSDDQISYSIAYPYDATGAPGPWWKSAMDSSLPVIADMAPLDGTGSPAAAVSSGTKAANSRNHTGDGQNVAYDDGHVDFVRTVTVGQGGDNIYTTGGPAGPSPTGVQPPVGPIGLEGMAGAYDTLLVPARNLNTGKLW